jgi:hypothetical protein
MCRRFSRIPARVAMKARIEPASTRPMTVLLGVATASLLAVHIVSAQGPIRDLGAVRLAQITQILNAGAAPAEDDAVTRPQSESEDAPAAGAALPAPGASSRSGPSAGLIINPIFDTTITSDPNAVAIENTINAAIANIESMFSDPITVTINFAEMSSGLGQSNTYLYNIGYTSFLAALKADATTSDDATAVALLPSVSTNPVNGNSTINVKTANLRAVGITGLNPPAGQPDGFISLNTTITNPGSPGTTAAYVLIPVVEHEIDEVLGLGSSLPTPTLSTIFPEDLFRYDQSAARTFTTTTSVKAFFSIDSSTDLAQFDNQNDGGDFGDWQSNPLPTGVLPKVQDAFTGPGVSPALSVELIALDVIGYNPVSPSITAQPSSQTITSGSTATMSVTASGTAPLKYQWYIGASGTTTSPISGATTSSYTTPALTRTTSYWVRVSNSAGAAASNTATVIVAIVPVDFDGDGKADITVYRPSTGTWFVLKSSTNYTASNAYQWGISTDVPVPGDYDGDGKSDIAVYRPATATWYILNSSTNFTTFNVYQWGAANGDVPVPGDHDGDGRTDLVVYRPSTATWYIRYSSTNYTTSNSYQWGAANGDVPVTGDYDGDGKTDIAVYRPSTATWFILKSSTNYTTFNSYQWGAVGDIPVPGDYDGDGKADIAIYRPSTATWFILNSSTNYTTFSIHQWGAASSDVPVPGDYDGDGKTDIAVYRPSTATWFVLNSSTNDTTFNSYQWGAASGDVPVTGRP